MGEEDIAAVSRLLRAAEPVDDHAPLGEHKWLDLVQGGRAGFAGFVAREQGHERVIGYAQLAKGGNSWSVEFVIHPSIRHADDNITTALLQHAIDEVARDGGGQVHLWIPRPTARHNAITTSLGFVRGRELYQMRRRLPLEEHHLSIEPAVTRTFVIGQDESAWLDLNRRAFFEHPEQGAWDITTLQDRERQPWFDAKGFLLHDTASGIDGFCWTKIHEEADELLGEIYVLGVDPAMRARGLGRSLLIAGLTYLADRSIHNAMLYVDADNGPAVALYSSLGFVVDHTDLAYLATIAPAPS